MRKPKTQNKIERAPVSIFVVCFFFLLISACICLQALCFGRTTFNNNHLTSGQRPPKNHVSILKNYTRKKVACTEFVISTSDLSTLNSSEVARFSVFFYNVIVWIWVQKPSITIFTIETKHFAFVVTTCSKLIMITLVKMYNICSKFTLNDTKMIYTMWVKLHTMLS